MKTLLICIFVVAGCNFSQPSDAEEIARLKAEIDIVRKSCEVGERAAAESADLRRMISEQSAEIAALKNRVPHLVAHAGEENEYDIGIGTASSGCAYSIEFGGEVCVGRGVEMYFATEDCTAESYTNTANYRPGRLYHGRSGELLRADSGITEVIVQSFIPVDGDRCIPVSSLRTTVHRIAPVGFIERYPQTVLSTQIR